MDVKNTKCEAHTLSKNENVNEILIFPITHLTQRTLVNQSLYRNGHKFLDKKVWANSADPDQTAPRGAVLSGSSLFAIPFSPF